MRIRVNQMDRIHGVSVKAGGEIDVPDAMAQDLIRAGRAVAVGGAAADPPRVTNVDWEGPIRNAPPGSRLILKLPAEGDKPCQRYGR